MTYLVWNILLALTWAAMTGSLALPNLAVGFVLGYAALRLTLSAVRLPPYFLRVPRALAFLAFLLYDVLRANLRVAYDVVTPRHHMRPGVVAVPLEEGLTHEEIATLASAISLTPGTLSLDVSDDRRTLYIHAMYIDDADALRRQILDGYLRRVLRVTR